MVGWHHRLNEHEFEQTPGGKGQGNLAGCSPWGLKESGVTDRLNNTEPPGGAIINHRKPGLAAGLNCFSDKGGLQCWTKSGKKK